MKLRDGTILPSHHHLERTSENTTIHDTRYNNSLLRIGRVVKAYYPDDSQNLNKKRTEYDVLVQQVNGQGALSTTKYRCTIAPMMGGSQADYINYSLRADPESYDSGKNSISNGSTVLVMCVNGHSFHAYIVGGSTHRSRPPDSADDGHFYESEFNGIYIKINNDGEYLLKQKGPTDLTGSPNTLGVGSNSSYLQFDKNGSFNISVDSQGMVFDKFALTTTLTTNLGCTIKSNGKVQISSLGVMAGLATDAWMKGTTYRAAQTALHTTLMALLTAIGSAAASGGSALTAAGPLHLIPIAGPIIASPFIATAGASLASIGALAQAMQAAISAFEALSPTYLSLKNFTD